MDAYSCSGHESESISSYEEVEEEEELEEA